MRLAAILLTVMSAASAMADTPPRPGDTRTLKAELWACDEPIHKELDRYVIEGDEAAFEKHLRQSQSLGKCVELLPGTAVTIGSMSYWSGRTEVRVRGEPKVWTATTQSVVEAVQ